METERQGSGRTKLQSCGVRQIHLVVSPALRTPEQELPC